MQEKIRLAIPNKGRLRAPVLELLASTGIELEQNGRSYLCSTTDPRFEVVFARAFDVPVYVQFGSADIGITGHDLVLERESDVHQLLPLGFGSCSMVVAVPEESPIQTTADITGIPRIVTEYPNISRRYFEAQGVQTEILEVRGATEIAPKIGLGEIVVDITSTGETLRKNSLRIVDTILNSTTMLICNKLAYRRFETEIASLISRVQKKTEGCAN